MNPTDPTITEFDSRSQVFDRLDPDRRRKLNRAIVDFDPPTYRALYAKFNLKDAGVHYLAFYRYQPVAKGDWLRAAWENAPGIRVTQRCLSPFATGSYARRLRLRAAIVDAAETKSAPLAATLHTLPDLLAQRILEALSSDRASSRALHRLAQTYRLVTSTRIAHQNFELSLDHDWRARRDRDLATIAAQQSDTPPRIDPGDTREHDVRRHDHDMPPGAESMSRAEIEAHLRAVADP